MKKEYKIKFVKDIKVFLKKKKNKRKYDRERCRSLLKEEKQMLVEYRKKYEMRKVALL